MNWRGESGEQHRHGPGDGPKTEQIMRMNQTLQWRGFLSCHLDVQSLVPGSTFLVPASARSTFDVPPSHFQRRIFSLSLFRAFGSSVPPRFRGSRVPRPPARAGANVDPGPGRGARARGHDPCAPAPRARGPTRTREHGHTMSHFCSRGWRIRHGAAALSGA
eukprot:4983934-Prymnesium_polylepis.1